MSFSVNSKVKLNFGAIRKLDINSKIALEQTTDALLTEIKNAQIMPFDCPTDNEKKKGATGGTLQNENTFSDYGNVSIGRTRIISNTPYARRLYYHPEYNFDRAENKSAGGKWIAPWLKGGARQNFCSETFAKIYKGLLE